MKDTRSVSGCGNKWKQLPAGPKTIGLMRKLSHRSEARVKWIVTFTAVASNLVGQEICSCKRSRREECYCSARTTQAEQPEPQSAFKKNGSDQAKRENSPSSWKFFSSLLKLGLVFSFSRRRTDAPSTKGFPAPQTSCVFLSGQ